MGNLLYRVWFKRAVKLVPGDKIWLPVETKEEAKRVIAMLKEEKELYMRIDPKEAARIQITLECSKGDIFVKILKRASEATIGYVYSQGMKGPRKVMINTTEDRIQAIQMILDGGTSRKEDIENALEFTMTDDEVLLFEDALDKEDEV